MASSPLPEEDAGASNVDPITKHILQRTNSQHKHHAAQSPSTQQAPANGDDSDSRNPESEPLRRMDTGTSSKPGRDKKKGVSFLSRFMGNKKRDETIDMQDNASVISDNRPAGSDAEVFSQPVGYIPKFPAPPKYIRVKAYNRQKRDLDRLFLAQILMKPDTAKDQQRNSQVDSKILGIGEKPIVNPPNSSRKSNNAVWAAEFSHDGRYFAAAGQDKKVRVWEVISTKDMRNEEDESSDADSTHDARIRLNAPVFREKLIREYDGHTSSILDLSWSKNNFLLSSSMDKTVRLYHVSREECLCAFKHNDFVTSIQFHPRDDRFFLAGSLDAKLRLWSIPDKSVAYWAQVPEMITAVAFTPDGKTAIAGCLSGVCILYNTEGLKAHSQIHVRSTRGRNTRGSKITGIDTIAIQKDNDEPDVKLLITSNDSRIRMYNLKDRQLEVKFRGNENVSSQIRATFSDDGRFVVCGSEDRKVYVWPTGPVEKQDQEKRPMEVFDAHSSVVTVATFAPTASRRLLALAGDPIYDVCNPPPVVLMSRTDSGVSSPAPTQLSGNSDDKQDGGETKTSTPPAPPQENPVYFARSAHHGGFVIVTADQSGQIKVFREDCAYHKRREAFFDTGSVFSKKMLGRSGSVATRTSATSSTRRTSLNLSTKSPSTDRIINWRNSIATSYGQSNGVSDFSMRRAATDRDRSSSPRKSFSHRFSLRSSGTPLAHSSAPSSPDKLRHPSSTPEITVMSPDSSTPHTPQVGTPDGGATPALSALTEEPSNPASPLAPNTANGEAPKSAIGNRSQPFGPAEDGPLQLIEGRSYMAWDTGKIMSMLRPNLRTPGLSADGKDQMGNPMSRAQSYVSQLSIEQTSSSVSDNDNDHDVRLSSDRQKTPTARTYHRQASTGTNGTTDEEELRCKSCGHEQFRMVKLAGGGRGLKCRSCSAAV